MDIKINQNANTFALMILSVKHLLLKSAKKQKPNGE